MFLSTIALSQSFGQGLVDVTDVIEYQEPRSYSLENGRKFNQPEFYTHPDFGKLTFKSPYGKNVVEDISKRTETERFYIDVDHPSYFYVQKSSNPINIYVDGFYRAIDPSMHKLNQSVFVSGYQPYETSFDAVNQRTKMSFNDQSIEFNRYQLKIVHLDNSIEILDANWASYQMNNFRGLVTNIFPGIDMSLEFGKGRVKSNFIIKQNLNVKELIFIDQINLSNDLEIMLSNQNPFNQIFAEIYNSVTGETEVVVKPASSYDSSGNREGWLSSFQLYGDDLHTIVDSANLNKSGLIYPLIVDPTFIAVGPVTSAFGTSGTVQVPGTCTHTLIVSFPGGAEPWDTQFDWNIYAQECAETLIITGGAFVDQCWMSDARLSVAGCALTSPVMAPPNVWACIVGACFAPGFWAGTVPFGSSGTQDVISCYPTQCLPQNMTFTISAARGYCTSYLGNDMCPWASTICVALDDWSVTVQGRSVETLGNTATGNGTQNIFDADCAGTQTLDPTPLYGVPGYTYAWSHGPTSPTVSVPGTVSTYTVDVTDACGTTVTATFDIGCPLSAEITDFSGIKNRSDVELSLKLKAQEQLETITFMKSNDGENWTPLKSLLPSGELDYSTFDTAPKNGINYYRVFFTDIDGVQSKSEIIEIEFNYEYSVYPNPAQNEINFSSLNSTKQSSKIVLIDLTGRVLITSEIFSTNTTIDISTLENGNYSALIYSEGELVDTKRISVLR